MSVKAVVPHVSPLRLEIYFRRDDESEPRASWDELSDLQRTLGEGLAASDADFETLAGVAIDAGVYFGVGGPDTLHSYWRSYAIWGDPPDDGDAVFYVDVEDEARATSPQLALRAALEAILECCAEAIENYKVRPTTELWRAAFGGYLSQGIVK